MSKDLRTEIETAFRNDPRFGGIKRSEIDHQVFGNQLVIFIFGALTLLAAYDRGDLIVYLKSNDGFVLVDTAACNSPADLYKFLAQNEARLARDFPPDSNI